MGHHASQRVPPPSNPPLDSTLLAFDSLPFQQDWKGVGANYSVLPGYGLSPAQKQADYDRVARSGVKVVSTWFDTSWVYTSGYPVGSPDYLSAKMLEFYDFIDAMKQRGVKVFIKMGWHFPQNVGAPSDPAHPITPTPANEATYAAFVSESLNQLINVRGFDNVTACYFFTEPSTNQMGSIPGGYATPQDYYVHVVGVAVDKIVADDAGRTPIRPRIKIVGPSTQSFGSDTWLSTVKASGRFDELADHSYCDQPLFPPFGLVASQCAGYQPWIDRFQTRVDLAAPLVLTADEGGFLVGGDGDITTYRGTADVGWQWVRQIDGHMQAGCSESLIWLLADQPILGDPVTGPVLRYGAMGYIKEGNTVKPAWYAISLLANLTGGGLGTKLFRCSGGNIALHGTAAFVPFGVRNAVNPAGEWSFVVVNEGPATDVQVNFGVNLGGRTVYRYSYSGEFVPPAAADPAYLSPWTRAYTNVATSLPTDHVPGRGFVIYSTMNIAAPVSENLALAATVTTDSLGVGAPQYTAKGNPSNCTGQTNGWRKADDGSHYLEYAWNAPITVRRLELAFVATTTGIVYATYADASTPAPLADYAAKYWNGSTFVDFPTPISVAGNAQPNRTHTTAPVSTTRVRFFANSVAATAQVNNVGIYPV